MHLDGSAKKEESRVNNNKKRLHKCSRINIDRTLIFSRGPRRNALLFQAGLLT